jgi:class 3 adenylate cyclase
VENSGWGDPHAARLPSAIHLTFPFADLVGYTPLTEAAMGDAAADLAREFRRTMCALSADHGARQVKSMGDGVMAPTPPSHRLMRDARPGFWNISTGVRMSPRGKRPLRHPVPGP